MKPLSRKRVLTIAGVLAGFTAMILYTGGFLHRKTGPETLEHAAGKPVMPGAKLVTVAYKPDAFRTELTGTVVSDRSIRIGSRLSAAVIRVAVAAGDTVAAGDVLIELDRRELDEQLAAAEAQWRQADAEFQRHTRLLEAQASTEQALTAAEATLAGARAQVERIRATLSYATLAAPVDGIVAEVLVEAGDLVSPGQPLMSMYDPQRMRLEVAVPSRLMAGFAAGRSFIARFEDPAVVVTATVAEIKGAVDSSTRTRTVLLNLPLSEDTRTPGAFGRIAVEEASREVLFVPREAIRRVGQLTLVDVVIDGRSHQRMVRTGVEREGEVEILAGLSDGDHVVLPPPPE